jgi:hypothetical protein
MFGNLCFHLRYQGIFIINHNSTKKHNSDPDFSIQTKNLVEFETDNNYSKKPLGIHPAIYLFLHMQHLSNSVVLKYTEIDF